MDKEFYYLVYKSKNQDKESLLALINKFDLLIRKYSLKLNYDGSYSDLIIYFISAIYKLPIDKPRFNENKYIISYLSKTVKNAYIYYSIKKNNILSHEINLNDEIWCDFNSAYNNIDNKIYVLTLLSNLSEKEKMILYLKYFKCYSDVEIGNKYKITRQAVNKCKNVALNKLKNIILNYEKQQEVFYGK